MMHNHSRLPADIARLTSLGAFALALGAAAACNNFLTADNPGAVEAQDLNDSAYANLIASGAIFAIPGFVR